MHEDELGGDDVGDRGGGGNDPNRRRRRPGFLDLRKEAIHGQRETMQGRQ